MLTRPLGKTGLTVSAIGIGTEHLDGKPYQVVEEVIRAAHQGGINMMDLFMPGQTVRQHIGRALQGIRQDFVIQGAIIRNMEEAATVFGV